MMSALRPGRLWRRGFFLSCVLMVLAVSLVAPHLTDSAELVRMRNALLLEAGEARFDWTPLDVPADFAREEGPVAPAFAQRADELGLAGFASDWDRALAIGRHLLANRQGRVGWPIQADLESTYLKIRDTGEGYCGDFADVFAALAIAAGLEVRSWAFSFDGFGGRGHIFSEVWDRQSGTWRMIDVFHNYYVTDEQGGILSALAFRNGLLAGEPKMNLVTLEPAAKPVFALEPRAWDFYRRGLHQWYLWWGNSVFTYDDAAAVRMLGPLSRSLEQIGAIAQGVHPRIRVLPDPANQAHVEAMQALKDRLSIALVLGLLGAGGAVVSAIGWQRARRAARGIPT